MAGEHQGDDREGMVESKYGADGHGCGCGLGRTAAKNTGRRGKSIARRGWEKTYICLPRLFGVLLKRKVHDAPRSDRCVHAQL